MLEHEDAGALPRFDQPVGGKAGDRLADHGAADTPKVSVSWPSVGSFWPGRDLARQHLVAQRGHHALGELRLAFDAGVGGGIGHCPSPI